MICNGVPEIKFHFIVHTKPATKSPPTVPWEPIDATANREINEICSWEMPDCCIRHKGWDGFILLIAGLSSGGDCERLKMIYLAG